MSRSLKDETSQPQLAQARWEQAYLAFETPAAEQRKFIRRLNRLGQATWPRSARIVELFCGRGGGLLALETLGFTAIEGVDVSASLVKCYAGKGQIYVADCRALPFAAASKEIVIVQGGLHHLTALPEDLATVLAEVERVLVSGGRFVVVEPWLTPFLQFVHAATQVRLLRTIYQRLAALATMIDLERPAYFNWLHQPGVILELFASRFKVVTMRRGWGKIEAVFVVFKGGNR